MRDHEAIIMPSRESKSQSQGQEDQLLKLAGQLGQLALPRNAEDRARATSMLRCWHPRVKIGADPIRKMPAKSLGPFQALVAGALEQSLHLDTVHEARSAAGLANLEMCIGRQAQLMYVGLGICDVPLSDIECLVVPHGIFAVGDRVVALKPTPEKLNHKP